MSAHSERYRNLTFEIHFFFGNIALPLPSVMLQSFHSKLIKKYSAEDARTAAMGKTEKTHFKLSFYLFTRLHAAEPVLSHRKMSAR